MAASQTANWITTQQHVLATKKTMALKPNPKIAPTCVFMRFDSQEQHPTVKVVAWPIEQASVFGVPCRQLYKLCNV
jgi:hypothetical protein